jgi:hypothetical protein
MQLKIAFARHHSRRRARRAAFVAGAIVCLLISLAWLRTSSSPHPDVKVTREPAPVEPVAPKQGPITHAADPQPVAGTLPAHSGHRERPKTLSKVRDERHAPPAITASGDFVALPMFDPAVPLGQSRMMRVEMPGSALQLIGYPVTEDLVERRVLTDVLVGEDGVPYAVRLVQTRDTH